MMEGQRPLGPGRELSSSINTYLPFLASPREMGGKMIGSMSQSRNINSMTHMPFSAPVMNSEALSSLDDSPVTKSVHVANFAFRGESPPLVHLAIGKSVSQTEVCRLVSHASKSWDKSLSSPFR